MKKAFSIIFIIISFSVFAQYPIILSQRDQAKVMDELLEDRLRTILPALMRREGIDMWVLISRENNEDPVLKTMLPATWLAARRTTMLVVFDKGPDKELEYLAVARYDVGKVFKRSWDPDQQPEQWQQLGKIIEERSPKKIAINKALHYGHAMDLLQMITNASWKLCQSDFIHMSFPERNLLLVGSKRALKKKWQSISRFVASHMKY
jgi:hypothetical protein